MNSDIRNALVDFRIELNYDSKVIICFTFCTIANCIYVNCRMKTKMSRLINTTNLIIVVLIYALHFGTNGKQNYCSSIIRNALETVISFWFSSLTAE